MPVESGDALVVTPAKSDEIPRKVRLGVPPGLDIASVVEIFQSVGGMGANMGSRLGYFDRGIVLIKGISSGEGSSTISPSGSDQELDETSEEDEASFENTGEGSLESGLDEEEMFGSM